MKKTLFLLLGLLFFCSPVFADAPMFHAHYHSSNVGWQDVDCDANRHMVLGSTGLGRRIEAIQFSTTDPNLVIEANPHVQGLGWTGFTSGILGTTGDGRKIEAIQIRLSGPSAGAYDLWYRGHSENLGWLDWTTGKTAGTTNYDYRLEAIELLLLPKGTPGPGRTTTPAVESVTRDEGHIMQLVNNERKARGLTFVTGNPQLRAVAVTRLNELNILFSHIRPNGQMFETAVKSTFPNYRLNGGGIEEIIMYGRLSMMDPTESYRVTCCYPHEAEKFLRDGARYMSWAGNIHGSMGYSIMVLSGLDNIDFQ